MSRKHKYDAVEAPDAQVRALGVRVVRSRQGLGVPEVLGVPGLPEVLRTRDP